MSSLYITAELKSIQEKLDRFTLNGSTMEELNALPAPSEERALEARRFMQGMQSAVEEARATGVIPKPERIAQLISE